MRHFPTAEILEARSLLTTYFVNDLSDAAVAIDMPQDGKLTLREALYAANADMTIGDAPAGGSIDTIRFDASLFASGTQQEFVWDHLELPLPVESNVSILGPGSHLLKMTPDFDGDFVLDVAAGGTSTVYGIEFFGGHGLRNTGDLRLYDVVVTGTERLGSVGILNTGDLLVHNSQVRDNRSGGGISNTGVLTVENSSILNNSGPGLYQSEEQSSADLTNVTISGNVSNGLAGGIHHLGGDLSLTHVTVTGNSGGIQLASQVPILNSLIAGNSLLDSAGNERYGDMSAKIGPTSGLHYYETNNDVPPAGVDAGLLGEGDNGISGHVAIVGDVGDRVDVFRFEVPAGLAVTEIPLRIRAFDPPIGADVYTRTVKVEKDGDVVFSRTVFSNSETTTKLDEPLGPGVYTVRAEIDGDQLAFPGDATTDFEYRVGLTAELATDPSIIGAGNYVGDPASTLWLEHGENWNIVGDGAGNQLPLEDIIHPVPNGDGYHTLVSGSPLVDAGVPGYEPLVAVHGATTQFRFNETSGTVAHDAGPLGEIRDGNVHGGTIEVAAAASPNLGTALQLDGVDDYVSAEVLLTENFTVEAWAKSDKDTWNTDGWIASSRNQETQKSIFIIHPDPGTERVSAHVHGNRVGSFDVPEIETWHHYALNYDHGSGVARFFVDGKVVAQKEISVGSVEERVVTAFIGRDHFEEGVHIDRFGDGAVDEFAFYDSALTSEQIQQHYNAAFNSFDDTRGLPFRRSVFIQDPSDRRFDMPDIGAYEHQFTVPVELEVTVAEDEFDGDFSRNDLSLREAIALANESPNPDVITFSSGLAPVVQNDQVRPRVFTLNQGSIDIEWDTQIIADPGSVTIHQSTADVRTFRVNSGFVELNGPRFTGVNGGGVTNQDGVLHIRNSNFGGIDWSGSGGAIDNFGTLEVTDTRFDDNTAQFNGGAIHNWPTGVATIGGVVLSSNESRIDGGAISNQGTARLEGVMAAVNESGNRGGAIYNFGTLSVSRSEVNVNAAINGDGGGIYNEGDLHVSSSTIAANHSRNTDPTLGRSQGGGIFSRSGDLSIVSTTISENKSTSALSVGGGLAVYGSPNTSQLVSNSTISGNDADLGNQIFVGHSNGQSNVILEDSTLYSTKPRWALFVHGDVQRMSGMAVVGGMIIEDVGHANFAGRGAVATDYRNVVDLYAGPNTAEGLDVDANRLQTDPMLERLDDNGGRTMTHKLKITSPAANYNSLGRRLTDQRGVPTLRSQDSGAYEASISVSSFDSFSATSLTDTAPKKVSQFAATTLPVAKGIGFDDGQPGSEIPREPGFLGAEFDTSGQYGFGGSFLGGGVDWDLAGKIGLEYGYYVNAGSVTVDYDGAVFRSTEASGNNYVIDTYTTLDDGRLFTESPRIGAYLDGRIDLDAKISAYANLFFKRHDLSLPHIDIDETIPLASINRQVRDRAERNVFLVQPSDPQADPGDDRYVRVTQDTPGEFDDLFYKLTKKPESAFKNDIEESGLTFEQLADRGIHLVPFYDGDIKLGTGSPFDRLQDAGVQQNGILNEIWDARDEGDDPRTVSLGDTGFLDNLCLGQVLQVCLGEAEGSLLGLQADFSAGVGAGPLGAGLQLGSMALTLPDVQLVDSNFDNAGGRLSASTSQFVDGSELDKKRNILKSSLDVAALFGLGTVKASLGPAQLTSTSLSYRIEPTLAANQDVSVVPFFHTNQQLQDRRVVDPVTGTGITLADSDLRGMKYDFSKAVEVRVNGQNRGTVDSVWFRPGSEVVVVNGDGVTVTPTLRQGYGFRNQIGLDVEVKGILKGFQVELQVAGSKWSTGAPLIGPTESDFGGADLGKVFTTNFSIPVNEQKLPAFELSGGNDIDSSGVSPAESRRIVPGTDQFGSHVSLTEVPDGERRFFNFPLTPPDGQPGEMFSEVELELSTEAGRTMTNPMLIVAQDGLILTNSIGEETTLQANTPVPIQGTWTLSGFDPAFGDGNVLVGFTAEFDGDRGPMRLRGNGRLDSTDFEFGDLITPSRLQERNESLDQNMFFVSPFREVEPGQSASRLDIDGDGVLSQSRDLHWIIQFLRGTPLDEARISQNATRSSRAELQTYLATLDLDLNGDATTDSTDIALLREIFHVQEPGLTRGFSRDQIDAISDATLGGKISPGLREASRASQQRLRDQGHEVYVGTDDFLGLDTALSVSEDATPGSSAHNPLPLVAGEDGLLTVSVEDFGQVLQYETTSVDGVAISHGAVGTPPSLYSNTVAEMLVGKTPGTREDYPELNITTDTRSDDSNSAFGQSAFSPIFLELPDAGGYEVTSPDGLPISDLLFDATVGNNRWLNRTDEFDGSQVDFDIYIPDADLTNPFSAERGRGVGQWRPAELRVSGTVPDANRELKIFIESPGTNDFAEAFTVTSDGEGKFEVTGLPFGQNSGEAFRDARVQVRGTNSDVLLSGELLAAPSLNLNGPAIKGTSEIKSNQITVNVESLTPNHEYEIWIEDAIGAFQRAFTKTTDTNGQLSAAGLPLGESAASNFNGRRIEIRDAADNDRVRLRGWFETTSRWFEVSMEQDPDAHNLGLPWGRFQIPKLGGVNRLFVYPRAFSAGSNIERLNRNGDLSITLGVAVLDRTGGTTDLDITARRLAPRTRFESPDSVTANNNGADFALQRNDRSVDTGENTALPRLSYTIDNGSSTEFTSFGQSLAEIPLSGFASVEFVGGAGDDTLRFGHSDGPIYGPIRFAGNGGSDEVKVNETDAAIDLLFQHTLTDVEWLNTAGNGTNAIHVDPHAIYVNDPQNRALRVSQDDGDVLDLVGTELFRIDQGVFLREDIGDALDNVQSGDDVPELLRTELQKPRADPDGLGLIRRFDGISLSANATISPLFTGPQFDNRKWVITDDRHLYTIEIMDSHFVVRGGWRMQADETGRVFEFNDGFRPWLTGTRVLISMPTGTL